MNDACLFICLYFLGEEDCGKNENEACLHVCLHLHMIKTISKLKLNYYSNKLVFE
jgi:hypothetical protein